MTRRNRLVLWSVAGLVTLLAGAITWLFTADLGTFKPQIEQLVRKNTGRDFRIAGDLSIRLGRETVIVAENIRFQNADWANETDMLRVQRLELRLDLWSLVNGPPVVRLVDLDGTRVYLQRLEDGEANWQIGQAQPDESPDEEQPGFDFLFEEITIDDARLVFDSPERTGPIDLRIDELRQQHRDDEFLELDVSGSLGERTIQVAGEIGTWRSLLSGENIRYELEGRIDSFSLSSNGYIDSLLAPRRPSATFSASGPDVNALLRLAGVEASGSGDIQLEGELAAAASGPLQLSVEGNVGRLEIDANGSFSDLADIDTATLDLHASGPDLARILRLFDIHSIREAPFELELNARRQGEQFVIERAHMLFAAAEFDIAADMPNFPSVDDANISLRIDGQDIERFREILNLPGTATGEFSIFANLETGDDLIEIADMRLNTSLGQLEARGTLGQDPGLIGTELRFDLNAPSLARMAGHYGLPRLPDEPVEISGTAVLESAGIRTQGPLVLQSQGITLTLDGLIRTVRGLYGSRLRYSLDGPDLARLIAAFAETEYIPAQPYSLAGILEIEDDGFGFRDVIGKLGNSDITIDGSLIPVRGLTGTRFELSAEGPEIREVVPAAIDLEFRPGPYALSGAFTFGDTEFELDDVRLERATGDFELDLAIGRGERRLAFTIDANGRDVRSILSRVKGIEAESAPFAIDAQGEFFEKRLVLGNLDIAIGDAVLNASGDLNLNENARSTRFPIRRGRPQPGGPRHLPGLPDEAAETQRSCHGSWQRWRPLH